MKSSHICPKCRNNRLLYLSRVGDYSEDGKYYTEGSYVPFRVAHVPNPNPQFWAPVFIARGTLEAYICRKCGYTEFYTRDLEDIVIDGKVVREVVGPEGSGPYR